MTKFFGYRSLITVTTTTAETEIGQVRSISGPGTAADDVDTTTMDSSTNFRTFVPGLIDPGEVTFEVVYDPADSMHKRLFEYHQNRTAKTYKVYHGSSTGDTDSFSAYVKGLGREIPMDDLITAELTLKVSGIPGYTS